MIEIINDEPREIFIIGKELMDYELLLLLLLKFFILF